MFVDILSISHIDASNKITRGIVTTKGGLKGSVEYFTKNPSTFPEVSYLNAKTIPEKKGISKLGSVSILESVSKSGYTFSAGKFV